MPELKLLNHRADAFYPVFERKSEAQHQTHYCPGCGHGVAHKLLASAIDELGIQDRVILISPVGCSVFAYYYFDVGNVQVAHGRAAAVATAVKRSRPDSIVISYQGDGDLAAIGTAEIIHAANRGENITTLFVNNAIYGMTGGQMAPTTLLGRRTTTSPYGRNEFDQGMPLHVSEMLSSLEAPVYIERVSLGSPKAIIAAKKAIKKALEMQMKGLGFSLVEVLSACPTVWGMQPLDAQKEVRDSLAKTFVPAVYRDRSETAVAHPAPLPSPDLADIPRILKINGRAGRTKPRGSTEAVDYKIKIAGFGGQGVLMLGQVLAEAGMDAGLEVSWIPSYGPEMRSGTSNCHVRLSSRPVDSPLISRPGVLLALNEPSLRKFLPSVIPGGLVLYNGGALPEDCRRPDLDIVTRSFTAIADELGEPRAGNLVMLGAFLALTNALPQDVLDGVLQRIVKTERWLEIDRRALLRGALSVGEA